MSEEIDWFSVDLAPNNGALPPEIRLPPCDIKGTYISRALNFANPVEKSYCSANMSIGWLGDLGDPDIMADKLEAFWTEKEEELSFEKEMYFKFGNIFGDAVARRMVAAQFCNPNHVEYNLFDYEYRWKGRIDLVVCANKLKHFCAKTVKGDPPTELDLRVADAKQTSVNNYSRWKQASDLPKKYQFQLNTYLKLHDIPNASRDRGVFFLGTRDNPGVFRPIDFHYSEEITQEAVKYSQLFWVYIVERSFPEGKERLTKTQIEDLIEIQTKKGRLWPKHAQI